MTDKDFHEATHHEARQVIYRARHPETGQMGWAGFVEKHVCVHLGWHRSRFAVTRAARKAARRA